MGGDGYYERYWSADGFNPRGVLYPALETLLVPLVSKTTDVLDLGCGDGQTAGAWLTRNAATYRGVDVSAAAVGRAAEAGLDVQVVDDAAVLPFADGSFDLVVCLEVLEHLFDPIGAAREALRVLRPGGRLFVTVPNVAHWRLRADLLVLGRWNPLGDDRSAHEPWRDPHIRFFGVANLRDMLGDAGYRDVAVGAHSGPFLSDVPGLRRLAAGDRQSTPSAWLTARFPALFGRRLHAVATRER